MLILLKYFVSKLLFTIFNLVHSNGSTSPEMLSALSVTTKLWQFPRSYSIVVNCGKVLLRVGIITYLLLLLVLLMTIIYLFYCNLLFSEFSAQ